MPLIAFRASVASAATSRGSSHVHARSWSVSSLGDAVVNPDLTPVHLHATHCVPCLSRIIYVLVVDESKASASATVPVQDNVHFFHRSKFAKLGLKFPLRCVETQPEDTKTLAWIRVFPVAQMPATGGHRRSRVITITASRTGS